MPDGDGAPHASANGRGTAAPPTPYAPPALPAPALLCESATPRGPDAQPRGTAFSLDLTVPGPGGPQVQGAPAELEWDKLLSTPMDRALIAHAPDGANRTPDVPPTIESTRSPSTRHARKSCSMLGASRGYGYAEYVAPAPRKKRSRALTSNEPCPLTCRRGRRPWVHVTLPRKHLRGSALDVEPVSIAPPNDSAEGKNSSSESESDSTEDSSSEDVSFDKLPRFRALEGEPPTDVDNVMKDLRFPKVKQKLANVHDKYLFKALYANQIKALPVLGALEEQIDSFHDRLRASKKNVLDMNRKMKDMAAEASSISSPLYQACENLRDCLLYLGSKVSSFPSPDSSNQELTEWLAADPSYTEAFA
ncbi:hypothetical protein EJB05_40437, partial [Eragrostis curvula]